MWVPPGTPSSELHRNIEQPSSKLHRNIEQQCTVDEHGGVTPIFLYGDSQDSCMHLKGTRDAVWVALETMLRLQLQHSQALAGAVKREGEPRAAHAQYSSATVAQPQHQQHQSSLPRAEEDEFGADDAGGHDDAQLPQQPLQQPPQPPQPTAGQGSSNGGGGGSSEPAPPRPVAPMAALQIRLVDTSAGGGGKKSKSKKASVVAEEDMLTIRSTAASYEGTYVLGGCDDGSIVVWELI